MKLGFLSVLLLVASALPVAAQPAPENLEFFENKIRPVLVEHCYRCHGREAKKLKGGLRLDSREGLLKGGDNGTALVPGQPDKSRLIEAVGYKNVDLQMPPRAKLPDHVIADLAAWVKMGAPWPKETAAKAGADKYAFDLHKRKEAHWCWQPLRPQTLPKVKNKDWPRGPIDQFLLAKLEGKGLTPAPPAEPQILIRRLYFDLIGLPPTPKEVEEFAADCRTRNGKSESSNLESAITKVVDRLLASPQFGERWARHWLDLVRYGESRGHEFDYTNPNAYQYRDYVIRALNADLPYDRFVTEHLAGDLLAKPRQHPSEGFNESILATGFWFLGEQVHSPVDTCQDKADRFDNMLDVMTKSFLGLTVACARCHDHKFDAISTRDYYSLFGFLESSSYRLVPFDALEHNRGVAEKVWKLRDRLRDNLKHHIMAGIRPVDDMPAVKDPSDPFYPLTLAATPAAKQPDGLREVFNPLLETEKKRQADAAAALKDAQVVVDYAKAGPEAWIQDGIIFGPRPVRPGDLYLGKNGDVQVQDQAAAVYDPSLDKIKPAPGSENDPGALGGLVRAGRTLRTPTFEITTGKIYYLVRGAALAYAGVDGHVMIAGPLHGQLVNRFKAGDGFQWVAQDLSRYKGRRGHLEFTPEPGSNFALAMVIQAEKAPGKFEPANPTRLSILERADSLVAVNRAYQQWLLEIRGCLERGQPLTGEDARLLSCYLKAMGLSKVGAGVAQGIKGLQAEEAKLLTQLKTESRLALAILDGSGVDERVFIRGNYKTPGETVSRRFLEALAGPQRLPLARGSGRLELARQMTDPAVNPLLPRVLVNRLWHHLFGRGIVASVDNFGVLGELPTHPELLDYLADRFVQEGWSLKKMIRAMVLTSAYQMSSQPSARATKVDPQNLLLHRARVRRLEGEAIRDALLKVSGRLDAKMYGPSVPVHLTEFQEGRGRPASGPLDGNGRRSLYLAVRRNFLPPMLLAFDTPIPFSTVGRRTVSNVPAQALILLNDPFVHQQAELWAKRTLAQPGSAKERITSMYQSAFARPPSEAELNACLEFLNRQTTNEAAAWKDLAHVLFNAKEFIFLQ